MRTLTITRELKQTTTATELPLHKGLTSKTIALHMRYSLFLYKNLFYKNVEAGINQDFKNVLRTLYIQLTPIETVKGASLS